MNPLTRRGVLGAAGALALSTLATPASAAPAILVDASHATPELASLLTSYFATKTRADLDGTMAFFDRRQLFYTDATLGYLSDWDALRASFAALMPTWPKTARSYPTRILGDTASAMVLFTNTPELFGGEIQAIGSVDIRRGKIQRWVDHWDGRHFGSALAGSIRVPPDKFPQDFGESTVGERASPVMKSVVTALSTAFAQGYAERAASLFADDAVFEDLTLHTTFVGLHSITGFLRRALTFLPYGGTGVKVRHTVGSAQGGGYEWTTASGATVHLGAVALELDPYGRISRLTTVWDGSLITNAALQSMLALTIEQ